MKENKTMIVLTTRKQQIVNEYGINTTFTEEQMKDICILLKRFKVYS